MTPAQEIEKEAERIWRLWQPNPLMHDPPLSELEKIKLPDPPKRYPRFFVPTSVVGMEIFLGPYVSLQCFCVRYDLPDSAKGLTRHEGITVVNKWANVCHAELMITRGVVIEINHAEAKLKGFI